MYCLAYLVYLLRCLTLGGGESVSGADIDTLCVAPRHVDRSEFFSSFFELLKKEPGVRELRVGILCVSNV